MEDHTALGCRDFVDILASKAPVPGGGGASALVGAIGMALGNMVGSLTVGKAKYADVQDDIIVLKKQADSLQDELLNLVRIDAEAFEPLSAAYGLPKDTEEEKAHKAEVMEQCLRDACAAPLDIMRRCCEAIELHEQFAAKGTAIAISDVGVGVVLCKSALQGASLNVFINTASMLDRRYAEQINTEANRMLEEYTARADVIFTDVAARFN